MGVLQPSLSDTVSSFSSGIYVLAAELKRSSRLEIGGLGRHSFPKGFYLYVGSAQRNLAHRLRRHLSEHPNGKKLHWHIDYLLAHARVRYIWGFAGPKDWECRLSRYLTGLDGVQIPLNGFGSSDCHCKAHLFYFPEDRLSQYIELIKNKLTNGFWNEIIGAKEIIFIFKFKKFVDTSPYCLLYDKPFCNRSQEEYLPQRHQGRRCRVRDACRCPAKVNPAH